MFILVVVTAMLAGTVRALHEVGLWNIWQIAVFALSDTLPADGSGGTVFAGLRGYNDAPTVGKCVAYVGFCWWP